MSTQHNSKLSYLENATAILVHGAWADGSSWARVVGPLQREGLRVICAPIPLTSLRDDAAALERVIDRTKGPIILVGHAYAGAVIAEVHNARIKALVYIAALAPDKGETVADVFYRDEAHADAPQLEPDANGLIWMPEEAFGKAFAQRATTNDIEILAAVQRPIAVACIQEVAGVPGWKATPTWYLAAEHDHMINPKTQHFMAGRMNAHFSSADVDHTPSVTAPDVVVATILDAAGVTLVE